MKNLILLAALCSITSASASTPEPGTYRIVSISPDWSEIFDTLTFARHRENIQFCKDQYAGLAATAAEIASYDQSQLTDEERKTELDVQAAAIQSADLTCEHILGKRKADKIRKAILVE